MSLLQRIQFNKKLNLDKITRIRNLKAKYSFFSRKALVN